MSLSGQLRRLGIETNKGRVQILGDFAADNVPASPGSVYYVKPSSGVNTRSGQSPALAGKTLLDCLTNKLVTNKNDAAILIGEGNASAAATDYQSATLDWNKDLTHLLGYNAGSLLSQRSRIGFISTYTTASNLMTVSGHGNLFRDLSFYAGVNHANPTGCLKVTGTRNVFDNCHIAGIGHDTNDIAGAYSLMLDGAQETLFNRCVVGLDTIARGSAANSEILVDGAAARNVFRECIIISLLEHGTNHPQVKLADATAIDRWLLFDKCLFINISVNYAYTNGGVMSIPALTQGYVIVKDCMAVGASKWDVNDSDKIQLFNSPTPAADTAGLARAV